MLAPLIPLSLYIHIPWCVRKCPYCDFNSHEKSEALPERAYVEALLFDLDMQKGGIEGRTIETIFIGGGTPSLFSPDSLETLLKGVQSRVPVAHDAEITLEANPGTAEASKFNRYREIGLTRLSIGIQSFDHDILKKIGRIHDGHEAINAAKMAKDAGFSEFNLDLMFGLPGQDEALALNDIETAIDLDPTHLSFYQLTLEPNTVFHKYPPILPEEEDTWRIQELGQSRLRNAGFRQYEVSAYARAGSRCRHNLNYWEFGDYLGIGAGAHGKLSFPHRVLRQVRWREPATYMDKALAGQAVSNEHEVARKDLPFEYVLNALRLPQGFVVEDFCGRTGLPPSALARGLSLAQERGLVEPLGVGQGQRVVPTARGFDFLSDLQALFLPADPL